MSKYDLLAERAFAERLTTYAQLMFKLGVQCDGARYQDPDLHQTALNLYMELLESYRREALGR